MSFYKNFPSFGFKTDSKIQFRWCLVIVHTNRSPVIYHSFICCPNVHSELVFTNVLTEETNFGTFLQWRQLHHLFNPIYINTPCNKLQVGVSKEVGLADLRGSNEFLNLPSVFRNKIPGCKRPSFAELLHKTRPWSAPLAPHSRTCNKLSLQTPVSQQSGIKNILVLYDILFLSFTFSK